MEVENEVELLQRRGKLKLLGHVTTRRRRLRILTNESARYVVKKDAKDNVVFVSRNYYSIDKKGAPSGLDLLDGLVDLLLATLTSCDARLYVNLQKLYQAKAEDDFLMVSEERDHRESGHQLEVPYMGGGLVDGTTFISTRDKGEPFTLKAGQGGRLHLHQRVRLILESALIEYFGEDQYAQLKESCSLMFPVVGSGKFITTRVITENGDPIQDPTGYKGLDYRGIAYAYFIFIFDQSYSAICLSSRLNCKSHGQSKHEVNEIRAEKIARVANPLALVAQQQQAHHPHTHPNHFNQNSSTYLPYALP
nr:hypothetical protein [Tanacetum cinerariifolium]